MASLPKALEVGAIRCKSVLAYRPVLSRLEIAIERRFAKIEADF